MDKNVQNGPFLYFNVFFGVCLYFNILVFWGGTALADGVFNERPAIGGFKPPFFPPSRRCYKSRAMNPTEDESCHFSV
jgi:hypothetical protein